MASDGLPVERLRQYLRQLPAGSRALLIAELERAAERGDAIPGGDMLLAEVRRAARGSDEDDTPRIDAAARRFLRPLDPFLVDGDTWRKFQGRIARTALDPLWAWICRDVVPAESKNFRAEVGRLLSEDAGADCEHLVSAFQGRVIGAIRTALVEALSDDKTCRRLVGQIGTTKALEDARDLLQILQGRDALALIESRLPEQIQNLSESKVESTRALLDCSIGADRELLPFKLVLVMRRLAAPWQLIRLAVSAAESDDAARISGSPYAAAVTIVLGELDRMVGELKRDLERGDAAAVVAWLRAIHDGARGLRTELNFPTDSPWQRQLMALRAEIANLLKERIEALPARVRRLLRPRPASEITNVSWPDPAEVAEIEALIEIAGACRNYASELAINEMTQRGFQDLQQYLDTGTSALLDGLRHAGEGDRQFRQSQVDVAVRFCAKVFGQQYASLLTKAAEVAANSERKLAARA
jgi:hypothetical protein